MDTRDQAKEVEKAMTEVNSTHKVEVFRIDSIHPHLNADSLEIIRPFGGYQCVVKKGEWKVGDLAAYVPPDNLVPLDHPQFSWLKETGRSPKYIDGKPYHRVTAVKLRKEVSLGLIVSAIGAKEGTDLASVFGVLHYDPPGSGRDNASVRKPFWLKSFKPTVKVPVYDLEPLRRFMDVFTPGESVIVTEKIHGANARYIWDDSKSIVLTEKGVRIGPLGMAWNGAGFRFQWIPLEDRHLWVGSRRLWLLKREGDDWWKALTQGMKDFLRLYPKWTLYGEVYGDVQDLKYGFPPGVVNFVAFDLRDDQGAYVSYHRFGELMKQFAIPTVPYIGTFNFNGDEILSMAEGKSLIADHLREGIVVRPLQERIDPRVGRVVMKVVSSAYLERAK